MSSIKELECWEIMNCSNSEGCLARLNPGRACWTLVEELDDYRAEFDVCKDCIVHMVKKGNITMSIEEINAVRESGLTSCVLAARKW